MNTWIVTGGAGFIGANFVQCALEATDVRLVVLDRLTYAGNVQNLAQHANHPRFHFVRADIADATAVAAVFRDYDPTALLNFAAESHVDRSIDAPEAFVQTNLVGTFTLLEAARSHCAQLGPRGEEFRFLHVSTDEVYGSLDETGRFSESTAYAPNSPYAATKAGADHLVRAYHRTFGLPTLITNCSNNYGPFQFPEKVIPLMILNALEARDLPIYGDGQNVRDWIYVEDHCRGVLSVLEKGRIGQGYNIGAGNERSNLDLIDILCEELEARRPARENPAMRQRGLSSYGELKTFVPDRPGHDRRYAVDSTKIQGELGWRPAYDLARGLGETVDWYLDHPEWCEAVQSGTYRRERLGTTNRDERA